MGMRTRRDRRGRRCLYPRVIRCRATSCKTSPALGPVGRRVLRDGVAGRGRNELPFQQAVWGTCSETLQSSCSGSFSVAETVHRQQSSSRRQSSETRTPRSGRRAHRRSGVHVPLPEAAGKAHLPALWPLPLPFGVTVRIPWRLHVIGTATPPASAYLLTVVEPFALPV